MKEFLMELLGEKFNEETENQIYSEIEKAFVSNESYKELEEKLKSVQEEHKQEVRQIRLQQAIQSALSIYGAKNEKAVTALLDEALFDIDDQGTVLGLDEQMKALQKTDSFLFEDSKIKGLKPAESIEPTVKSPKQMSYGELCEYFKRKNY